MVSMRLQDTQEAAVLGEDRQPHYASRQYPAICRLRELDRASQDTVDLLEPRIPGVRKTHAQWDKVPVCQLTQYSVECEGDKLGMLSGQLIERGCTLKSQYRLVLLTRDLKADFL